MTHTSTFVSLVLSDSTAAPTAKLNTYGDDRPIGSVKLDDGLMTIQTCEPQHLRALAAACTDAAQRLADELDRQAARAVNALESVPA